MRDGAREKTLGIGNDALEDGTAVISFNNEVGLVMLAFCTALSFSNTHRCYVYGPRRPPTHREVISTTDVLLVHKRK